MKITFEGKNVYQVIAEMRTFIADVTGTDRKVVDEYVDIRDPKGDRMVTVVEETAPVEEDTSPADAALDRMIETLQKEKTGLVEEHRPQNSTTFYNEIVADDTPVISDEELTEAISKARNAKVKAADVKALLTHMGVSKASELPQGKRQDFINELTLLRANKEFD